LNSCISMHVLAFLTGFVNLDIDFFPSFLWMKHSSLFFPTKVPHPPSLGPLDDWIWTWKEMGILMWGHGQSFLIPAHDWTILGLWERCST
jgi:hypothetical protein